MSNVVGSVVFQSPKYDLKAIQANPKSKWRKAKVLLQSICGENALGYTAPTTTADTNIQTTLLLPRGILFVLFILIGSTEGPQSMLPDKEVI